MAKWEVIAGFLVLFCNPAGGQYQTLGPDGCGIGNNNCHTEENKWYVNDAHKKTVNKLEDDPDAVLKYLSTMKMTEDDLYKRDNMCMACHGTSVTAQKDVDEGVSCESCHGPGSGYKDPHSEGKEGGAARTGYVRGVSLGMKDFKRDKTQVAAACVRCHYITDNRLLNAGHSNGAKFNYVSKIKDVAGSPNHWKRVPAKDEFVKDLFEAAKNAKKAGAPSAVIVPPASREESPAKSNQPTASALIVKPSPSVKPPTIPQVRPVEPSPTLVPLGPVDLPPFPVVTDSTRLDSLLLILKQRLELLHLKVRGQ